MTLRRITNVVVVGLWLGSCLACSHFDRDQARELVARVGADRIRAAAESLRDFKTPDNQAVPSDAWPEVLRELEPEEIFVDETGVSVSKYAFFVESEGIYILFKGEAELKEHWGDPSIWLLAEGIYWYQYTG
jgi:hypothetical protein